MRRDFPFRRKDVMTPLMVAVKANLEDVVHVFLKDPRIDLERVDHNGKTLLDWARAKDKRRYLVNLILEAKNQQRESK